MEISINTQIDSWSSQMLSDSLNQAGAGDLTIRISSPGGSVLDGFAMATAIQERGNVTTYGAGYVASIASVILLAGDKVKMAENAFLMIHNPYSFTEGDAAELRKQAEVLDKMEMAIADVYANSIVKRKGKSYKTALASALQWMEAETWFTAKEALAAGLIDEVVTAEDYAKDSFNALAKFERVPKALFYNYKFDNKMQTKNVLERFLALFENESEPQNANQEIDKMAEARQLLEDAGFMVLDVDAKAEYEQAVEADAKLPEVLAKVEAEITALREENRELKAQAKASVGAPSGASSSNKPAPARRTASQHQKAFDAFASLLKDSNR